MEASDYETLRKQYAELLPVPMDVRQQYGWTLLRFLNNAIKEGKSVESRRILTDYVKNVFYHGADRIAITDDKRMGLSPKLHSAILSSATKMAISFPDFHFVPFLKLWDIANLQPDDYQPFVDESGKHFPSLVQKLHKAVGYSKLFHPDESSDAISLPVLPDAPLYAVVKMLVSHISVSDVKGRKMTFAHLISVGGTVLTTEVHALTSFSKTHYSDLPGLLFDVLLRKTDKVHVETAKLNSEGREPGNADSVFTPAVGYVEHIDLQHNHIHIYDNHSRHFVAVNSHLRPQVGQYVLFTPIIPKDNPFKSAIIRTVYSSEDGKAAFSYRTAKITYTDTVKGFCAWELQPESDGTVRPIVETIGTLAAPQQAPSQDDTTKGYLSQQLLQSKGNTLPAVGTIIHIIVFLKRGKDGTKRPYVVEYR